jgi:hypothetical protein
MADVVVDFVPFSLAKKLDRLLAMDELPDVDVSDYFTLPEFLLLLQRAAEMHGKD